MLEGLGQLFVNFVIYDHVFLVFFYFIFFFVLETVYVG